MKRMAKSGEDYFTSSSDAIVFVKGRVYPLQAGIPTVVEFDHIAEIELILKGDGSAVEEAGDSASSDVAPRQYRRKTSEA